MTTPEIVDDVPPDRGVVGNELDRERQARGERRVGQRATREGVHREYRRLVEAVPRVLEPRDDFGARASGMRLGARQQLADEVVAAAAVAGVSQRLDDADARAQLDRLVRLYARGLAEPLPFFPRTTWAFVANRGKIGYARSAWNSNPQYTGESADVAIALAFRGVESPLDAAFESTARDVFGNIMDHIEDSRL